MSVIFLCRWGLKLSYAVRAIFIKFQFKLQPSKIEKKIHIFRPAALALLEGETGKTWYQYINSMRTISFLQQLKGWMMSHRPSGLLVQKQSALGCTVPRRARQKVFQKCSTEGMDLLPEVAEKAGCPPACLPKGLEVKGVVTSQYIEQRKLICIQSVLITEEATNTQHTQLQQFGL